MAARLFLSLFLSRISTSTFFFFPPPFLFPLPPHTHTQTAPHSPSLPKAASLDLAPIATIEGTVRLPGSKSLSNRVLLLAALAEGETTVENLLDSEDIRYMVSALQRLGVEVAEDWEGRRAVVKGCGGRFPAAGGELFLGNAGTAMRPLTAAVAAAGRGDFVLDGVARMRERPIEDLVAGLRQLGVDAECTLGTGCPPVRVAARGIAAGGRIELSGKVSSQYLTALLMAAPLAEGKGEEAEAGRGDAGKTASSSSSSSSSACTDIVITDELISQPYVDMTIRLMTERFGAEVERVRGEGPAAALRPHFRVPAGQRYSSPGASFVEGDASSASYFLAGAAITGGTVRVEGCGSESLQGDVRFAEELARMGCRVEWEATAVTVTGPSARSPGEGGATRLRGIDADCVDIPDAAMTLAVAALFAEGKTTIRNVGSWYGERCFRLSFFF